MLELTDRHSTTAIFNMLRIQRKSWASWVKWFLTDSGSHTKGKKLENQEIKSMKPVIKIPGMSLWEGLTLQKKKIRPMNLEIEQQKSSKPVHKRRRVGRDGGKGGGRRKKRSTFSICVYMYLCYVNIYVCVYIKSQKSTAQTKPVVTYAATRRAISHLLTVSGMQWLSALQ